MGRNKPRSKAVDVTKSLLQPTSITDYIAVQVNPNQVIQVAEEDLSPTQGSEAAFALRREGKLDTTMKLCLNWRQGNCHNHAACSFAHVSRYFGLSGDSLAPPLIITTSVRSSNAATSGASYSSVAAGVSGRTGQVSAVSSNTSWPQKRSPPSYATTAPVGGTKGEEQRPAASAEEKLAAPAVRESGATNTAAEGSTAPTTAVTAAGVRENSASLLPSAALRSAAAGSATGSRANASALAAAPTVPPAVLSAEGLGSILLALSTSPTSPLVNAVFARSTSAGGGDETPAVLPPREALAEIQATHADAPTQPWQVGVFATVEELVDVLGRQLTDDTFGTARDLADLYTYSNTNSAGSASAWAGEGAAGVVSPGSVHASPHSAAIDFRTVPVAARVASSVPSAQMFSTAPTTMRSVTSHIGQLGSTGAAFSVPHSLPGEDGELQTDGFNYHNLMTFLNADE